MTSISLEKIYEDLILVKKDVRHIMETLDEDSLELGESVKSRIKLSRTKSISNFKTQGQMEKKFL